VDDVEHLKRVPQQRVGRALVAVAEDRLGDVQEDLKRERFAL